MATKRRINCKFCSSYFREPDEYVSHMEKEHYEMIPSDMTPKQFVYYLRTGKTHGECIVDKAPTPWKESTGKYARFCGNPECAQKYRKMFEQRMIGKHGKVTLLNDPEQQKKMLANRSISGKYVWSDRFHEFVYTGKYELSFLKFLDAINFDPTDIITPSPHTYTYIYNGKNHMYIPDVYIPSLNLEIEIKDGGSNPNTHPKIMMVDKEKERLKDEVMRSNKDNINYLKIVDKRNERFFDYLELSFCNFFDGITSNIIMI